jgi:hypothetical protein
MEQEVFDIQLLTNRPTLVMVTKALQQNKVFMDALKDLPSGTSLEEQQKFFASRGFKAQITKYRHVALDDFPEDLATEGCMTREEIRQSAFIFKVKKDRRYKQCRRDMPLNLKKRQRAEYWKNCGYVVKETFENGYERTWTVSNPIKKKI